MREYTCANCGHGMSCHEAVTKETTRCTAPRCQCKGYATNWSNPPEKELAEELTLP